MESSSSHAPKPRGVILLTALLALGLIALLGLILSGMSFLKSWERESSGYAGHAARLLQQSSSAADRLRDLMNSQLDDARKTSPWISDSLLSREPPLSLRTAAEVRRSALEAPLWGGRPDSILPDTAALSASRRDAWAVAELRARDSITPKFIDLLTAGAAVGLSRLHHPLTPISRERAQRWVFDVQDFRERIFPGPLQRYRDARCTRLAGRSQERIEMLQTLHGLARSLGVSEAEWPAICRHLPEGIPTMLAAVQPRDPEWPALLAAAGRCDSTVPTCSSTIAAVRQMRRSPWIRQPYYIKVNIPQFMLEVVEDGRAVHRHRVMVGRDTVGRFTPVLSSSIQWAVLNPEWHIPGRILRKEILKDDALSEEAIQRHGYEPKYDKDGKLIGAYQLAGDDNALGKVKIVFPNHGNIYLHDTPSRYLFDRPKRAFSHGCVRVENPELLVEELLEHDRNRLAGKVDSLIGEEEQRWVHFRRQIPIHIEYRTVIADDAGRIGFLRDWYGEARTAFKLKCAAEKQAHLDSLKMLKAKRQAKLDSLKTARLRPKLHPASIPAAVPPEARKEDL